MAKKLTEFERGVLYAAVHLQRGPNESGLAAYLLRESGFSDLDCSELDEYDKEALRVINEEKDMALLGLE